MVKLRLRRKGRIHSPVYDIVVIDSRKRRDGAFIERLGYYDPKTQPCTVSIKPDRAIYWLGVGAQPSDIVNSLLSYEGVLLRRSLAEKGKPLDAIEAEVTRHREVARNRYFRHKELRKKRLIAKEKAKAAAAEEKKEE